MKGTQNNWVNLTTGLCLVLFVIAEAVGLHTRAMGIESWMSMALMKTKSPRVCSPARTALAWRGMLEGVTFSFVSRREAELFGGGGEAVTLANPISADLDVMRPTPLANLATAATAPSPFSRSARSTPTTRRKASAPWRSACARARPRRATGPAAPVPWTSSTPRATPRPC